MTDPVSVPLVHGEQFFNIRTDSFIISGTSDGCVQLMVTDDFVDIPAMNVVITKDNGAPATQFQFPGSAPVRVVHGRLKLTINGAKLLLTQLQTTVPQVEAALEAAVKAAAGA